MSAGPGPLLTLETHTALLAAREAGAAMLECSLDLGRTVTTVVPGPADWHWAGGNFPYLDPCKDHTVYHWDGTVFAPIARYTRSLVKLVPTGWGPPTFEIDGVKMLPTAEVSPWDDAARKVALITPRGKRILDTCGGLGYFAAWCLHGGASQVVSFEKNPDVLWLRSLNPWSPDSPGSTIDRQHLELSEGDVGEHIGGLASASFDAVLHDPPRFAIAGELYSQAFYAELARVLKPRGRLFHYTGSPNQRSRGRNLAAEVTARLRLAGFTAEPRGDGVFAVRAGRG